MDLLIHDFQCPKVRTTIYGIYNILQIQEKFGLDVTEGFKNLIS